MLKTNEERLKFIRSISREYEPPTIYFMGSEYLGIQTLENGTVLGNEGFGYEWDGKKYLHFPHRGDVRVEEDVEFGANCVVDRATLEGEATVIGKGTKLDNLIHVAHNCKIGTNNLICAGVSFSGSVETGDGVTFGVGCIIKQKVKIGDGAFIGAGAVVLHDVPAGAVMVGNPARVLRIEE